MDTVIQELLSAGEIVRYPSTVNAFRLFLLSKQDGSARPILDLSPWTPYYATPLMRLYSAAEVIHAIHSGAFFDQIGLAEWIFPASPPP
jgi:hypothetical protein